MGKTSAPLHFMTTLKFYEEHKAEFTELREKGHIVDLLGVGYDFNIFLDPLAWRTWTDPVTGRIANLDMATKAARVAKKLREKKK